MKKFSWLLFSSAFLLLFIGFNSCKKINEATELGSGLIPAVDNVNTFEMTLSTQTKNRLYTSDSSYFGFNGFGVVNDDAVIGNITNDPEFGSANAAAYFTIAPSSGTYPFYAKDSFPVIDSVVLSLAYRGAYGDTAAGSNLNFEVSEIAQGSHFSDTLFYHYKHPDFATSGVIGSKTFALNQLKDSFQVVRKVGDTVKMANVLRIPLNTAWAQRFLNYDTSSSSNGAYHSDSIFYKAFSGLAVKASNSGNTLAYFGLYDHTKTSLTFYYRVKKSGVYVSDYVSFIHGSNRPQANVIKKIPGGGYASYLNNGGSSDDKIYLQSPPGPGSIASISIPGLDTLSNKIIHRAELIITKLPSVQENKFAAMPALFLDQTTALDTAYSITDDLFSGGTNLSPSFSVFGGLLRADNTYRFNITRHVQEIITNKKPNYLLRLYAPFHALIYASPENLRKRPVGVLAEPAYGRVVLAGGTYADARLRLQLHIIYSKIK